MNLFNSLFSHQSKDFIHQKYFHMIKMVKPKMKCIIPIMSCLALNTLILYIFIYKILPKKQYKL